MNGKNSKAILAFPGIGNVATITASYILRKTKHSTINVLRSNHMPAILINDDSNDFVLPSVKIEKTVNKDSNTTLYIGDSQPATDQGVYELSKTIVDLCKQNHIKQLLILGGIGLEVEPEKPDVYQIANNPNMAKELARCGAKDGASKRVNVVLGLSGVVYGVANQEGINASLLLAETSGMPGYLGLRAAYKLTNIVSKYTGLKIDTRELREEIEHPDAKTSDGELSYDKDEIERIHYIG
jgi:predicted ATP-grasp superfamily ATP-dependent carboligase